MGGGRISGQFLAAFLISYPLPLNVQCAANFRGVHKGGPGGREPSGADDRRQFLCKRSYFFGIFRHILTFIGKFPLLVGIFPLFVVKFSFFVGIFPFLVGKFKARPPLENGLCTPLARNFTIHQLKVVRSQRSAYGY